MHRDLRPDFPWLRDSNVRGLRHTRRPLRHRGGLRSFGYRHGLHHRRNLRLPHQSCYHPRRRSFRPYELEGCLWLLVRTDHWCHHRWSLPPSLRQCDDSAWCVSPEPVVSVERSSSRSWLPSCSSSLFSEQLTARSALATSPDWPSVSASC